MEENRSKARFQVGVRTLRYVAAALAFIVAGIHLIHPRLGAPRLIAHLQMGTLFDPRPLAFTISAFLIVFGILLVYNGILRREVYAAGILLMVTYIVGYVAWHTVLEHGGFWPHILAHGHRDIGALEAVRIHLADDTVALVSKIHEAALLCVLAVLYLKGDE